MRSLVELLVAHKMIQQSQVQPWYFWKVQTCCMLAVKLVIKKLSKQFEEQSFLSFQWFVCHVGVCLLGFYSVYVCGCVFQCLSALGCASVLCSQFWYLVDSSTQNSFVCCIVCMQGSAFLLLLRVCQSCMFVTEVFLSVCKGILTTSVKHIYVWFWKQEAHTSGQNNCKSLGSAEFSPRRQTVPLLLCSFSVKFYFPFFKTFDCFKSSNL